MIVGFVISIAHNDICRVKFPIVITTITILLSVNIRSSVRGFFRSLLCNDCLVVISRDMINIRDKEPLEGTTEQQRYAQWTYDYDFGHLKDKFSE